MKKSILYIFLLSLCLSIQFSCKKKVDANQEVNKVVTEFFDYINQKDFDKMKEISSPQVGKYIDFIQSLGDDLVEIDSVKIVNTTIKDKGAVVNAEIIDIYGYKIYYKLSLTKETRKWKLTGLNGYGKESKLTKEEIKYTKQKHQVKDSIQ
jgi:hypothetical protein